MTLSTSITIAYGDGIGPEIMEAALFVLKEAGAKLEIETIEIGERIYNMGGQSGILPSAWETLHRTGILLKAPVARPAFEGRTSVNDALLAVFAMYDYQFHGEREDFSSISKHSPHFALFEPNHKEMPEMTGKNTANPSCMLHAAIMMLRHIGQPNSADTIQNAWLRTIEDGIHPRELYRWGKGKQKAGTREFADAVADRLGQKPQKS